MEKNSRFQSLPIHTLQGPHYRSPSQSTHRERRSVLRASFVRLSKSPVNGPPPDARTWPLCGEMTVSRTFLYLSLKFPAKRTPLQVPQTAPLWRVLPVCRNLFYIPHRVSIKHCLMTTQNLTFLSKYLVQQSPSMSSQRGPYGETWSVSGASSSLIHSFIY